MAFGAHWEWRGFGTLPQALREVLDALPLKFPRSQLLTDEYLHVPGCRTNVKLRLGDLKFKRLLEERDGLERWLEDEDENHAFPLAAPVVEKLGRDLGIAVPESAGVPLGREELLEVLRAVEPGLRVVAVEKERWQRRCPEPGFADEVTVELAEIRAPEPISSVGLECTQREPLERVLVRFDLPSLLCPMSYLDALDRWARGERIGG